MDKLRMMSMDNVQMNVEKIQKLFPNAVTEVLRDGKPTLAIDFDVLKQELSAELIDDKEERYQMTWPDKKKSILLANTPISATLRPCKEESVDFDHTQNLYIEGDNLDVLKLLQETYLGKIKMIYIDPPYNTGNDFVYNDDFRVESEEWSEMSGDYDEQGNRLVQNTESNGRFHTDWLNMIYPRLKVAKDLLSDDGVLVVSMDDNEITNLQKVVKEIFGENNAEIAIWNKEAEGASGTLKQISTFRRIHEYVLFAYINKNNVRFVKIHESLAGKEHELQTANLAVNLENEKINHSNYFTITNPSGDTFTRQWKWSKKEIDRLIAENLIYWGSDGHKQPRLIIPTDERRMTFLLSILNYGGTTAGKKDFETLMGDKIEFSYPKPVVLLKKIISSACGQDDIILDFFSGSATTAHAVMQLNAEDGGNRKFIMVQLPEKCDEKSEAFKAGYGNICEIGKERIRRAGKKIKDENPSATGLDVGFRVLKLDSSNMKDVYYKPEDYSQGFLESLEDNIKADRTPLDLLFQVMLDLGKPLSAKIEEREIAGKHVFVVDDNDLVACFDSNVTEDVVKTIAQLKPLYAVFRDSGLSSDSVGANFDQIFATYSPNTTRKVL